MKGSSIRAFGIVLLAAAGALLSSRAGFAQTIQGLPRTSPHATITQTVGISTVTIDYHRPGVKGRSIWGTLVPYDAVWRAGANDNTTITFSDPVKIEGQDVPAGVYGLHMLPTETKWTVIFSKNSTSWGSFTYDEKEDAARVEVTPEAAPFEERLRFGFDQVSDDSATIALHWEKLKVPFTIEFDTQNLILAKIRRDLRHLPRFSWQGWNSAANYCLNNDVNQEEALQWADRSITMNKSATNMLTKAGLLVQLGREKEAAEIEEQAMAIASQTEVNQLGYQYLLQRNDVGRAIKLFEKNVKDYPDSWNAYDSLAEAYAAKGDKDKAIKNYTKALEMAPDGQKARIRGLIEGLKKS